MKPWAAAALMFLCGAPSAAAHQLSSLRKAALEIKVRASGSVAAAGVFRLKSTISGRVEAVTAATNTWVSSDQNIGILANTELAALLDAHGSTGNDILEERWQKLYKPAKIRCPSECFLLKSYIRPKQSVKAQAILVEAAKTLLLSGHVGLKDAHWIKYGQMMTFWPVDNPSNKRQAKIANYTLDVKGLHGEPGGNFTLEMTPENFLPPGTPWEGVISPAVKKNVLFVETGALIAQDGSLYLPVKISTGLTTEEFTEITGGAAENQPILILDDSKLGQARRHKVGLDAQALGNRLEEERKKNPPPPAPPVPQDTPESQDDAPQRDPDSGSDPYEE